MFIWVSVSSLDLVAFGENAWDLKLFYDGWGDNDNACSLLISILYLENELFPKLG